MNANNPTTDTTADLIADTWEVWGSSDPTTDQQPVESNVTRERAVELVNELQANGYSTAYAVDRAREDDDPATFYHGPTTVTVTGFESLLDLPSVKQFRTSEDGTLLAIDYNYAEGYPHLSGPVLHFQLPDGRIVITVPDGDGGFDLAWKENGMRTASDEVSPLAWEAIHMMRGEIDAAFDRLTRQFLVAAVANVHQALTATTSGSAT